MGGDPKVWGRDLRGSRARTPPGVGLRHYERGAWPQLWDRDLPPDAGRDPVGRGTDRGTGGGSDSAAARQGQGPPAPPRGDGMQTRAPAPSRLGASWGAGTGVTAGI